MTILETLLVRMTEAERRLDELGVALRDSVKAHTRRIEDLENPPTQETPKASMSEYDAYVKINSLQNVIAQRDLTIHELREDKKYFRDQRDRTEDQSHDKGVEIDKLRALLHSAENDLKHLKEDHVGCYTALYVQKLLEAKNQTIDELGRQLKVAHDRQYFVTDRGTFTSDEVLKQLDELARWRSGELHNYEAYVDRNAMQRQLRQVQETLTAVKDWARVKDVWAKSAPLAGGRSLYEILFGRKP
jgi:hypothetical protein